MVAKVPPFQMDRSEIRDELDRIRHPFRIAVDRAKNPFNIGAIIRTAHSFLAKEIILIGEEPWYKRAAMGMQRYENIVEFRSVDLFLEHAQENAWKLVPFEKDDSNVGMWEADIPSDAVLVFGNEDTGVARPIMEAADQIVGIPMFGINHSYPISIAAGIGMAEWARRHYQGGRTVIPKPVLDPGINL